VEIFSGRANQSQRNFDGGRRTSGRSGRKETLQFMVESLTTCGRAATERRHRKKLVRSILSTSRQTPVDASGLIPPYCIEYWIQTSYSRCLHVDHSSIHCRLHSLGSVGSVRSLKSIYATHLLAKIRPTCPWRRAASQQPLSLLDAMSDSRHGHDDCRSYVRVQQTHVQARRRIVIAWLT
jgi:hypothetical protein